METTSVKGFGHYGQAWTPSIPRISSDFSTLASLYKPCSTASLITTSVLHLVRHTLWGCPYRHSIRYFPLNALPSEAGIHLDLHPHGQWRNSSLVCLNSLFDHIVIWLDQHLATSLFEKFSVSWVAFHGMMFDVYPPLCVGWWAHLVCISLMVVTLPLNKMIGDLISSYSHTLFTQIHFFHKFRLGSTTIF